jgi:hypothetical protein
MSRSGGHIPVDMPNIIAGNVLTHLLEFHPSTAESTAILPSEGAIHAPTRLNVQPSKLPKFLGIKHRPETSYGVRT